MVDATTDLGVLHSDGFTYSSW